MFEIEKSQAEKVKIFGNEYEVRRPSVKQVKDLNLAVKTLDEADQFDRLVGFVSDLGIDRETLEELEIGQLESLVTHLSGSKKN